jgi:hypothetical protein
MDPGSQRGEVGVAHGCLCRDSVSGLELQQGPHQIQCYGI